MLTFRTQVLRRRTGLVLVPFLAVLVTWLTGFAPVWSTGGVSQSNFAVSQYGLPLFWKTRIEYDPLMEIVSTVGTETFYSWGAFATNTLLYAGLGYLLVLWNRRDSILFRATIITVSSGWMATAAGLFAWSSQRGKMTNGLLVPWMGWTFDGIWYYNLTLLAADVVFVAALEHLVFFLFRGIRWSKSSAGAINSATDPEG